MTERRVLGDLDFDSGVNDPGDGWYGSAQAEVVAAPELDDSASDHPRYPAEYDPEDPDPEPEPEETPRGGILAPRDERPVVPPTTSWESKLANSGAWDFKVSVARPNLLARVR